MPSLVLGDPHQAEEVGGAPQGNYHLDRPVKNISGEEDNDDDDDDAADEDDFHSRDLQHHDKTHQSPSPRFLPSRGHQFRGPPTLPARGAGPHRSDRFYDLISQLVFEYEALSTAALGEGQGAGRGYTRSDTRGYSTRYDSRYSHWSNHPNNSNDNLEGTNSDSHGFTVFGAESQESDRNFGNRMSQGMSNHESMRGSFSHGPNANPARDKQHSMAWMGSIQSSALSMTSGYSEWNPALTFRSPSSKAARAMILERWTQVVRELMFNDKFMLRRVWANQATRSSETRQSIPQETGLASDVQDPIMAVWKRRNWIGRRASSAVQVRQWRKKTRKRRWLVIHPDSSTRAYWACIGVLLLFVDLLYLTLSAFDVEQPVWYSLLETSYWAADMLVSFRVGILLHGTVNFNAKFIATRYLKSWFLFDVVLLAYQICALLFSELGNVKYLRLVRFLRIARVAKLDLMYTQFLKWSQSVIATMLMKMFLLLVAIMGWVHVSGCFWYGIATMVSEDDGWIQDFAPDKDHLTLKEAYSLSLYWAASQLQGGVNVTARTVPERCFAVIHTLLSVVLSALLIGKLMTVLQELELVQRSRKELMDSASVFMRQNKIPTDLCIIVQRYLRRRATQEMRFQRVGSEERLFASLPRRIKRALLEESRWLALGKVLVFETMHGINIKFANKICCDLMQPDICMPDDTVFHSGDAAKNMFFITNGQGLYHGANLTHEALAGHLEFTGALQQSDESRLVGTRVAAGTMLCEALMWVRWSHQGDFEVDTDNQVYLLKLSSEAFLDQVQKFGDVSLALSPHAERIAEYLNRGKRIDDLWSSEQTLKKFEKWSAEGLAEQFEQFGFKIRGSEFAGAPVDDGTMSASLAQEAKSAAPTPAGVANEVTLDLDREILLEGAEEVESASSLMSCDFALGSVREEYLRTHL